MTIQIIDRTSESASHDRTANGRTITRARQTQPESAIRGAFLHQCDFYNPRVSRYDVIIAHFAVLRSGQVVQVRPVTTVLNSVSAGHAVDIEFEGAYPSIMQIRRARRRGRDALANLPKPTVEQYLAGRGLLEHLRRTLGIGHVWAHRQTSRMQRDNCPGPQLWYNVGEWAIRNLNMSSGGVRRTIPDEWKDPALGDFVLDAIAGDDTDEDFDDLIEDLSQPGSWAR